MRILIIGAGRVGCGALGVALTLQGHELVFALRRPEHLDSLNRLGYDVVTKGSIETTIPVRGIRALFDLKLTDDSVEPVNLRLFLRAGGEPLSETWLYQWTPPPPNERVLY